MREGTLTTKSLTEALVAVDTEMDIGKLISGDALADEVMRRRAMRYVSMYIVEVRPAPFDLTQCDLILI